MEKKYQKGFTLLEITVSISLFALAILLVGSMYDLSQKTYNKGSVKAELIQNARVSLDRISRELRQAVNIETYLPESGSDPADPPAEEIFFQDGHDINQISYLRYYLSDGNLMRKKTVYYFSSEPGIYVLWNSEDQGGNPPVEDILEDRIVGEYFNSIEFWATNNLINISIDLTKQQSNIKIDTKIFMRN